MKLLITGSRKFNDSQALNEAIQNVEELQGIKITMLLHGGAIGADTLAQNWADENKIPTQMAKAFCYDITYYPKHDHYHE